MSVVDDETGTRSTCVYVRIYGTGSDDSVCERDRVFFHYSNFFSFSLFIIFFFCRAEASETSSLPVSGCPQNLASARGPAGTEIEQRGGHVSETERNSVCALARARMCAYACVLQRAGVTERGSEGARELERGRMKDEWRGARGRPDHLNHGNRNDGTALLLSNPFPVSPPRARRRQRTHAHNSLSPATRDREKKTLL